MHVKHDNDSKPSIQMLRECVTYNAATGALTWLHRPESHFSSPRAAASWNTRFGGKPVLKRNRGYVVVCITVGGVESYSLGHRVAWALTTGAWPEHEVDHRSRIRDDNRWDNLRPADHLRNQWNKGIGARNKTGVKGVHVHSQNGTFIAQIKDGDRTRHIGSFNDLGSAAAAYRSAEVKAHGQFSESHQ